MTIHPAIRTLIARGFIRLRVEVDVDYVASQDDPPGTESLGVVSECRPAPWSPWQGADSIWGLVGYQNVLDPVENAYILDLLETAAERLAEMCQVGDGEPLRHVVASPA